MSLSMYQASVPSLLQMLNALSGILDKTDAHCTERKIAPEIFLQARLFPDMFPFIRQIQIATDMSKGAVARLAGVPIPSYEDNETSIAELKARLAKTIAFITSLTASQIDGSEEKVITLKLGGTESTFTGKNYLFSFVFPNVYFHATTAYDILRHNGVVLTKSDYVGG